MLRLRSKRKEGGDQVKNNGLEAQEVGVVNRQNMRVLVSCREVASGPKATGRSSHITRKCDEEPTKTGTWGPLIQSTL